jgi:hypothetical protein
MIRYLKKKKHFLCSSNAPVQQEKLNEQPFAYCLELKKHGGGHNR